MVKNIIATILFLVAASALVSCEHQEDSKVPVEDIELSVVCDGFTLGDDLTYTFECASQGEQGKTFIYDMNKRQKGQDSDTLLFSFQMHIDGSSPFNGSGWLGTTEIECSLTTDGTDSKSIGFNLHIIGENTEEGYCTAVIQSAEITEGDYTCTLTPNQWDGRTSTTAVLEISPAESAQ